MRIGFLLLLLFILSGCASEAEKKGLEAITNFYGGQLNYKVGMGASTNTDKLQGRYVELELVNDTVAKRYSRLSVPASNCGYLYYKALTPEERKKYSFIRIAIKGRNSSYMQEYTLEQLAVVELAKDKFDEVASLIENQRYDELLSRVDGTDISPTALDNMKQAFKRADGEYGNTKALQFQGFEFFEHKARGEMQQMLSMFGVVTKEKGSGTISISVDPAVSITKSYVIGMNLN